MTERVGVTFDGNSRGAVGAARQTAAAIDKVKLSAVGSSAPLRGMEKDLGRVERGALAGSGAFHGLGRSVAFASGAFIGAAGFVEVVKSSIDVVLAAQTSIARLDKAVENAHASVKAMTPILEAHAAAARKLGFDDNETRDAEAKLVTAFGATKKSLDELRSAEDLARATSTDLGTATRQLILLQEGNARAAKQFGLTLPDLTKKQWEAKAAADGLNLAQEKGKTLYDELLPRIHAQAQAFANTPAGKIAEFHAQVQHLQESIGTGLLPIVDKYLTEVDDWLAKSKNQKKVTDDVRKVVDELASVLGDAKKATEKFLEVANPVAKAMGGWKTIIEGLIALKFASVVAGWATEIKALGIAAGVAGGAAGVGGLLAKLRLISAFPAYTFGGVPDQVKGSRAWKVMVSGADEVVGNRARIGNVWYTVDAKGNPVKTTAPPTSGSGGVVPSPIGGTPPGAGVQIPSVISPTHQTAGLPGFPAVDIMAKPGTKILAPENGVITRISGSEPTAPPPDGQGGPWGLSIYFLGSETGNTYYLTHLVKVAGLGGYKRGAVIGLIGNYPGSPADHVHVGIHAGDSPEAHVASGLFNPSDFLGASTKSPFGPDLTKSTSTPPAPAKTKWVGATQATITTAQGRVSALLKGLPADLDPVEKNAVAHIKAIQDSLRVHMSPAELAKDRVELTKWGKVLHDEINKNAKVIAAAAAEAKKVYDRALSLDMSNILRGFDRNFQAQMTAFDRETQRGLAALAAKTIARVAQTPEEKALADFVAGRAQAAQATTDAQQQSDLQAAYASGDPQQITAALDAINQTTLDKQQQVLQAAADASRVAADQATTDAQDAENARATAAQQAYQDQRDAQKQALQDLNDDQRTALQNSLDDWVQNLEDKKKSWAEFVAWLRAHGYDTSGLVNPSGGAGGDSGGSSFVGHSDSTPGGHGGFAKGGKIPGSTVGREDTILARVSGGEYISSRKLTAAMEDFFFNGGGSGSLQIVAGDVYLDGQKVGQHVARSVTDEQARQVDYTIQRG